MTQRTGPRSRVTTGIAALVCWSLSLLYFLPAFAPGAHIFGTDYLAGGYFFMDFISDRLEAGVLPKWVPYVYGGLPLYANPGSAFHPIRLLADLILPTAWLLPLLFVFQFGLAGFGMFLLLRELGARPWVALVAGLAFEFTGLPMSYVYAGHDGRVIGITSTALFFYFLHRGIRTGGLGSFVGAAATLGCSLLSFQIQSNYYMLLGGAIWAVFCLVHLGTHRAGWGVLTRRVALGLGAVAFAFAMAAVNFLPFLGYVQASARGGDAGPGWEYATSYSMPPEEILALAVPEQAGASITDEEGRPALPRYQGRSPFKLHTEYVGAFVVAFALLGAFYVRRDRYWWFFLGLAVFGLTIALGGYTPIYRLYYELLPGTKRFRAPNISFFLVAFSLVAMAGLALERLAGLRAERATDRDRRAAGPATGTMPGRVALILGGLLALVILGAAASGGGERGAGWLRFAVFLAAVLGVTWAWLGRRLGTRAAAAALALVTVADLWVVDRAFFQTTDPPEALFQADGVVQFLRSRPDATSSRSWVIPGGMLPPGASYARGQGNFLMYWDLLQTGGEHPLPLGRYVEFVGRGSGTLPDYHNLVQSPVLIDAAAIRYLVLAAEVDAPNWRVVHRGPLGTVYENLTALPRAYLVPEARAVESDSAALAAILDPAWDPRRVAFVSGQLPSLPDGPLRGVASIAAAGPDRVVVRTRADRDALLVLTDNYLEGWVARIDGQPATLLRVNH
ncbi:MAG: hypothetical protein ACRELV_05795, partial [Longimicrobiales bacterium]